MVRKDGKRIRKKRSKPIYFEVYLKTRKANEKALGFFFDKEMAELFSGCLVTQFDLGTDTVVIRERS